MPWDETEDYIRSGHRSPDSFDPDSLRTITVDADAGIKAVVGCPKGKYSAGKCTVGTQVQSYLFSKDKDWTMDKAKQWFSDHQETVEALHVLEPRHADFDKIYRQFQVRYCTGDSEDESPKGGPCRRGEEVYHAWLNKLGLDDTKPYSSDQYDESLKEALNERFDWARSLITFLRQEGNRRFYKVEALFPLSSMNTNVYLLDELEDATKLLAACKPNLNHTDQPFPVEVEGAEFEDGASEVLISADVEAKAKPGLAEGDETEYPVVDLLEAKLGVPEKYHIFHISIEASCTKGVADVDGGRACLGLRFGPGLAFLTKHVLPGVPLTRIFPVERIESRSPTEIGDEEKPEMSEQETPGKPGEEHELTLATIDAKLDRILSRFEGLPHLGTWTSTAKTEQDDEDPDKKAQRARAAKYGIGIKDGGNVTKPGEFSDLSDDQFADPVNYRYPIDAEHVMAAWAYINKPENRAKGGYTEEEWSKMQNKVKAAMKKFGHDVGDGKEQQSPAPEQVCGNCSHFIEGKCDVDGAEKAAGDECDKEQFTPKEEPPDEPEENEKPEETEEGEEAAPPEEPPTKQDFIQRYQKLRDGGMSAREAWRRAGLELVERIQR